jgi:hypothetical protein
VPDEVAVEDGEVVRRPRITQRQRPTQDHIAGGDGEVADVIAGAGADPQLAQAVFGVGHGEGRRRQPLGVRIDHTLGADRHQRVEPASAGTDSRGPQVAPRHGHEGVRRGGRGGEELAVHDRGEVARGRQPSGRPLAIAEQRVGDRCRRQQPLGGTEDDDHVDVEPDGAGQRADVDPVAELAVAPWRDIELGDERGPELGASDRAADAVEVLEAVEHA